MSEGYEEIKTNVWGQSHYLSSTEQFGFLVCLQIVSDYRALQADGKPHKDY